MTIRLAPAAGALLAGMLLIWPAAAQQSTPTPPPPTPNQPSSDAAGQLRGINPPPFPMAADKLPIPQLKLPKGFKVEVFVSGVPNARSLRLGDKGTVFVSNRILDKVYAVVEKDGKREAKVIASGMDRPNGLAFHGGALYIAEGTKVSKLEKIEDNLDNPGKPVVIYDQFPNHQSHGWKFMALGPDNKLYINVGAPCNICVPPDANSQIRRINLDGSGSEAYVRGVRNSVGFDFHPVTKELYFTDNGRDWFSEDLPHDELNRVTKAGQHFGYPYCHQGDLPDPKFAMGHKCDEFTPPVVKLGAHVAPLGMKFYTGDQFPAEYKNNILIAEHGSWNRAKYQGARIKRVIVDADGKNAKSEILASGWLEGDTGYLGRPNDIILAKDGSILVADDWAGAIYRISYKK